jgi:hypothetical protein
MTVSIGDVKSKHQEAQPHTVAALLRQLGLHNASARSEATALRAWVEENDPNRALRISIRRNGYGFVLDQRFGRPRRTTRRPVVPAAS